MKVFVINLDKDTDRMAFSTAQATKYGYEIERFPAVNGKKLSKYERKAGVKCFRFWCAVGKKPLLNEIGCVLSHQSIYQKMIENNIPYVCILEDDIIVLEGFKKKLYELENWMDFSKPQVVRLNFNAPKSGKCINGLYRSYEKTSACSYCLTLAAAKNILKENYPMKVPSDWWFRWAKKGIIELYDCEKQVCWHNNAASGFSSVIAEDFIEYHKGFISTIFHRGLRVIGKSIDQILFRIENFTIRNN